MGKIQSTIIEPVAAKVDISEVSMEEMNVLGKKVRFPSYNEEFVDLNVPQRIMTLISLEKPVKNRGREVKLVLVSTLLGWDRQKKIKVSKVREHMGEYGETRIIEIDQKGKQVGADIPMLGDFEKSHDKGIKEAIEWHIKVSTTIAKRY